VKSKQKCKLLSVKVILKIKCWWERVCVARQNSCQTQGRTNPNMWRSFWWWNHEKR